MKVYIGSIDDVSEVLTPNDKNVLWYPETSIPYNEWHDFLSSDEFQNATCCATQSSEVIKALEVFDIDCTVLIKTENDFCEKSVDEARLDLLGCYEIFMVREALFSGKDD